MSGRKGMNHEDVQGEGKGESRYIDIVICRPSLVESSGMHLVQANARNCTKLHDTYSTARASVRN